MNNGQLPLPHVPSNGFWSFFGSPIPVAIAWIVGVAGFALSIVFYVASLRARDLTYKVYGDKATIVKEGQFSNLSVLANGKPVKGDVSVAFVAVWNQGKEPIRPDHVLKPLIIRTVPSVPILDSRIRTSTGDVVGAATDTTKAGEGVVALRWTYWSTVTERFFNLHLRDRQLFFWLRPRRLKVKGQIRRAAPEPALAKKKNRDKLAFILLSASGRLRTDLLAAKVLAKEQTPHRPGANSTGRSSAGFNPAFLAPSSSDTPPAQLRSSCNQGRRPRSSWSRTLRAAPRGPRTWARAGRRARKRVVVARADQATFRRRWSLGQLDSVVDLVDLGLLEGRSVGRYYRPDAIVLPDLHSQKRSLTEEARQRFSQEIVAFAEVLLSPLAGDKEAREVRRGLWRIAEGDRLHEGRRGVRGLRCDHESSRPRDSHHLSQNRPRIANVDE